ncbi:MAG: kelch repeat-containing protein, partial [Planctomycetota bacterium]|nr:kelch repeat-containing protein [Planctomycetota bacterium]
MLRSHTLGFLLACSASLSAQGLGYWKKMPSLQIPRQEVGAAVIGGKIYVTGGLTTSRGPTDTMEIFDPATGKWKAGKNIPTTLHHHGCCAVNGQLYLIGGYISKFQGTKNCWRYD